MVNGKSALNLVPTDASTMPEQKLQVMMILPEP